MITVFLWRCSPNNGVPIRKNYMLCMSLLAVLHVFRCKNSFFLLMEQRFTGSKSAMSPLGLTKSYFALLFRGWCSMISERRRLASIWVYISVVPISSWPSMLCMARRLAPPSSRCVAKECRKVCGLIVFFSPVRSANSLMIWNMVMRDMRFLKCALTNR